jgi:hypothetical protein
MTSFQPLFANFKRHWRGELSLAASFWGNVVGGTLLCYLIAGVIAMRLQEADLIWVAIAVVMIRLMQVVVMVWQSVGLVRCIIRYLRNKGSLWLASATGAFLGILVASQLLEISKNGPNQIKAYLVVLLGDHNVAQYSITANENGTIIKYEGGIKTGSAESFRRALYDNPNAKIILIESGGGRVHEAYRIAGEIRKNGLDTLVTGKCASAAVLVFLAGKQRIASTSAKIGFHMSENPAAAGAEFSAIYRKELIRVGASQEFIAQVVSTSPKTMWYPTIDQLLLERIVTRRDELRRQP